MDEEENSDVYCGTCRWQGDRDELVCSDDDEEGYEQFNRCPLCESTYIEDV